MRKQNLRPAQLSSTRPALEPASRPERIWPYHGAMQDLTGSDLLTSEQASAAPLATGPARPSV